MEDLGGFVVERAASAVGFREIARVPVTDQGRFQKAKRFEYLDRAVIAGARPITTASSPSPPTRYYSAPSGVATITWRAPAARAPRRRRRPPPATRRAHPTHKLT